jgi:glyoxylase-like metal-dependent hydrolase (beta-lactamase superfamily II)
MLSVRSRATLLSALIVSLVAASAAFAQPRTAFPEKRGVPLSEFPRVIKLAESVYGYEEIRNPGMTTVSMFVVGRDGVMLVDGQGSVEATKKLVDAIAKTAPGKPIKWYVVGSDHGDHTAGNSVLPANITYIVSPASLKQLQADAENARGAAEKAKAEAAAKGTPVFAPRPPVVVPPAAMTSDKQVVDVGGIEAQVLNLGRAHTGGDLVVYLPKQKILFMSEVYLNRVFPAMRSAYPTEWLKVLDRALAMNVDRFIPGHGFIEEPKASREELVEYQKALKYVIGEVQRLHTLGLSADDARKQANWGPYKDWMLADQQDIIAIRKVYEEIEGKLK